MKKFRYSHRKISINQRLEQIPLVTADIFLIQSHTNGLASLYSHTQGNHLCLKHLRAVLT